MTNFFFFIFVSGIFQAVERLKLTFLEVFCKATVDFRNLTIVNKIERDKIY